MSIDNTRQEEPQQLGMHSQIFWLNTQSLGKSLLYKGLCMLRSRLAHTIGDTRILLFMTTWHIRVSSTLLQACNAGNTLHLGTTMYPQITLFEKS